MKDIHHIIYLVFFLISPQASFAQKAFKVIKKAKKQYDIGEYNQALKSLKKANKMGFGFCGNAHITGNRDIYLLRVKIHFKNKEYSLARSSLDSIIAPLDSDNMDSIRIRVYQAELGKDVFWKLMNASLSFASMECGEINCYVSIPLLGRETIVKFKIYPKEAFPYAFPQKDNSPIEVWKEKFLNSKNYALIQEEI